MEYGVGILSMEGQARRKQCTLGESLCEKMGLAAFEPRRINQM